jgi:hypothetical protein
MRMPNDVMKISIDTRTGMTYPSDLRATSYPEQYVVGWIPRDAHMVVRKSWRMAQGYE